MAEGRLLNTGRLLPMLPASVARSTGNGNGNGHAGNGHAGNGHGHGDGHGQGTEALGPGAHGH